MIDVLGAELINLDEGDARAGSSTILCTYYWKRPLGVAREALERHLSGWQTPNLGIVVLVTLVVATFTNVCGIYAGSITGSLIRRTFLIWARRRRRLILPSHHYVGG